jgi:tetratricopeptide (TPR) repeat protein
MTMAGLDNEKSSIVTLGRQFGRGALAILVAAGLLYGAYDWWGRHRYRSEITEIHKEMAGGQFGMAARNLDKLLAWKPGSDEATYLLGICEQGRGRYHEAASAWARVSPGSAFAHRAVLARMRLFYDSGRCADAEQLVIAAAQDPRNDRSDLRVLLVPVYSQLGRIDEAERLLRDRWDDLNEAGEGTSEQALNMLLLHIELGMKTMLPETARAYLDRAGREAPDDDRVWLGQANLAIRTGRYDLARRYLDASLRRRPDDAAVWRARVNWGIATDRLDVVKQALARLPTDESTRAERYHWNAWVFARAGDTDSESSELESAIAANPGDLPALEQLVLRAKKSGRQAEADRLIRKKSELERLRARYQKLFERKQPVRDAEEMAQLADQLGRRFEARAFYTLALAEEPDREDLKRELARLNQSLPVAKTGA